MASFEIAYQRTNAHEGGYANNPHDHGGETYAGISRHYHGYWRGWVIVDQLKRENNFPENLNGNKNLAALKKEFYFSAFWDEMNLGKVNSQEIANELYDTGVNMGTDEAIEFLQRSLNVLANKGLLVDGVLGRHTLTALNSYNKPDLILKCLNILQGYEYISICETNHDQKVFFVGWLNNRVSF